MVFPGDGNPVTCYDSQPLFNTATANRGALMACLNQDPYLLIFDAEGNLIWHADAKMADIRDLCVRNRSSIDCRVCTSADPACQPLCDGTPCSNQRLRGTGWTERRKAAHSA